MPEMRTTTGQRISIGYDPAANVLVFREEGWHAEAFRTGDAPVTTRLARPIGTAAVARLRRRRTGPMPALRRS